MLCLTRGLNEQIVIGDGPTAVVVTVVAIRGNKVRLGCAANRAIPIRRAELRPRPPREPDRESDAA